MNAYPGFKISNKFRKIKTDKKILIFITILWVLITESVNFWWNMIFFAAFVLAISNIIFPNWLGDLGFYIKKDEKNAQIRWEQAARAESKRKQYEREKLDEKEQMKKQLIEEYKKRQKSSMDFILDEGLEKTARDVYGVDTANKSHEEIIEIMETQRANQKLEKEKLDRERKLHEEKLNRVRELHEEELEHEREITYEKERQGEVDVEILEKEEKIRLKSAKDLAKIEEDLDEDEEDLDEDEEDWSGDNVTTITLPTIGDAAKKLKKETKKIIKKKKRRK